MSRSRDRADRRSADRDAGAGESGCRRSHRRTPRSATPESARRAVGARSDRGRRLTTIEVGGPRDGRRRPVGDRPIGCGPGGAGAGWPDRDRLLLGLLAWCRGDRIVGGPACDRPAPASVERGRRDPGGDSVGRPTPSRPPTGWMSSPSSTPPGPGAGRRRSGAAGRGLPSGVAAGGRRTRPTIEQLAARGWRVRRRAARDHQRHSRSAAVDVAAGGHRRDARSRSGWSSWSTSCRPADRRHGRRRSATPGARRAAADPGRSSRRRRLPDPASSPAEPAGRADRIGSAQSDASTRRMPADHVGAARRRSGDPDSARRSR